LKRDGTTGFFFQRTEFVYYNSVFPQIQTAKADKRSFLATFLVPLFYATAHVVAYSEGKYLNSDHITVQCHSWCMERETGLPS
jgi:hypothetical protein